MSSAGNSDRLGRTSRRRYALIFVVSAMFIVAITVISVLMMAGRDQYPYGLRSPFTSAHPGTVPAAVGTFRSADRGH